MSAAKAEKLSDMAIAKPENLRRVRLIVMETPSISLQ
jgi:hypothetical protein